MLIKTVLCPIPSLGLMSKMVKRQEHIFTMLSQSTGGRIKVDREAYEVQRILEKEPLTEARTLRSPCHSAVRKNWKVYAGLGDISE